MKNHSDIQYISSYEAAQVMEKTPRYVTHLCQKGRISGAYKDGKDWKIPKDSLKNILMEKRGRKPEGSSPKKKLSIAIGNTSYIDVSTKGYYVDKTLMIRDILNDSSSAHLFTRPRRFGKTLNLNMLKTFFEISDSDTSVYFRNKKIWACGEEYRQHQGQYPVIMLTFKDTKHTSWTEAFESIKAQLREEVVRNLERMEEDSISSHEKPLIENLLSDNLDETKYCSFLRFFSGVLYKYYNNPVVILIDEYDTPIQQGFEHGFYDKAVSFFRNFFSAGLKDNPYLAFGVMTGILRVSKENLFSGLNNLAVNTVMDDRYSQYFGFTTDEVVEMARYYEKEDKRDEIRHWYDGYRFGNTEIYNPWSVTNYFYNDCQARAYWANTSANGIIKQLLESARKPVIDGLYSLMQGKSILAEIDMHIIYPSLSDDTDAIFSFLLLAGYLKLAESPDSSELLTMLTIPNNEIRSVFNREIIYWITEHFSDETTREIAIALYQNNVPDLEKSLRKYMLNSISSFDSSSESFYQGMMLGLLASLSSSYLIRSNRESGLGRFDIQMEPKKISLPAVIMELKAARSSEKKNLNSLADEALKQIEQKQYYSELKEKGLEVCLYGIAFCGKDVAIAKAL